METPADYNVTWSNIRPVVTGRQNRRNVITTPGPQLLGDANFALSPLAAWQLYFSPTMEQTVVQYTNKRIQQVLETLDDVTLDNNKNCHLKPTDIMELRAFYGLSYARGAQHANMTNYHKLWRDSCYGHPIYSACLSRHRFAFLRHHITFDDPDTREERWQHDRFAAMRQFFEAANDNFSSRLQPDAYLTIDETLYVTRTNIAFRQYNPNKPAKYGLLFKSVNAALIPYTFASAVYAGKPVNEPNEYYIKGTSNVVKSLVNRLSQRVDLSGRNITTDRLYTTYDLTRWMMDRSMTTVGTLMSNRKGIPKELLSVTDRDTPSYKLLYDCNTQGSVTLHSYVVNTKSRGKKNVLLMSSQPPLLGVTKDEKKKPAMYKLYDYTKGGTDQMDYRMAANTVKTKSNRWTMTAMSYLLDTMRINSQTVVSLNRGTDPRKSDSTDYAWDLAIQLVTPHIRRRLEKGELPSSVKSRIACILGPEERHPDVRPQEEVLTKQRCVPCLEEIRGNGYTKNKNKMTRYLTRCNLCNKTICKRHSTLICTDCDLN